VSARSGELHYNRFADPAPSEEG
jgi:hypothetical protein